VVLRPHQIRASERVLARAREPKKRRGLIWHTQGSGKTYTVVTVARLLLSDPFFRNPTVLMSVDRNELQQQLFQNLESVGFGRVYLTRSKRHLHKLLREDTRGLIVSMIHKFDGSRIAASHSRWPPTPPWLPGRCTPTSFRTADQFFCST